MLYKFYDGELIEVDTKILIMLSSTKGYSYNFRQTDRKEKLEEIVNLVNTPIFLNYEGCCRRHVCKVNQKH